MDRMHELAVEFCEASELLCHQAQSNDWELVDNTQRLRANLLAQLQQCDDKALDQAALTAISQLLNHSKALEARALELVTSEHSRLGHEHNQLQRNQQARKAYGSFS